VGITHYYPLKFKANAGLTWSYGQWTLGWNARYFDSYLVDDPRVTSQASSAAAFINQGSRRVPSQVYHDVLTTHRFSADSQHSFPGARLLDGVEIQAGVINVFNKEPPLDMGPNSSYYFYYSTFGEPRLASYYLSIKKAW